MKNTSVKPIPDGYHTLTPFLMVKGAGQLLEFVKLAFSATINSIHHSPEGTVMHADLQIGDSRIMMAESSEKYPAMPSMIYMYSEDCDALYNKAIAAGGTTLRVPTDEFYGDRSCGIQDLAGNQWWIATHVEDVSPEEMKHREEEFASKQKSGT